MTFVFWGRGEGKRWTFLLLPELKLMMPRRHFASGQSWSINEVHARNYATRRLHLALQGKIRQKKPAGNEMQPAYKTPRHKCQVYIYIIRLHTFSFGTPWEMLEANEWLARVNQHPLVHHVRWMMCVDNKHFFIVFWSHR
jgi:hypothetical protein